MYCAQPSSLRAPSPKAGAGDWPRRPRRCGFCCSAARSAGSGAHRRVSPSSLVALAEPPQQYENSAPILGSTRRLPEPRALTVSRRKVPTQCRSALTSGSGCSEAKNRSASLWGSCQQHLLSLPPAPPPPQAGGRRANRGRGPPSALRGLLLTRSVWQSWECNVERQAHKQEVQALLSICARFAGAGGPAEGHVRRRPLDRGSHGACRCTDPATIRAASPVAGCAAGLATKCTRCSPAASGGGARCVAQRDPHPQNSCGPAGDRRIACCYYTFNV